MDNSEEKKIEWFVMRDLTRPNAKMPAWKRLEGLGVEYFTPMVTRLIKQRGRRVRITAPFMHDLLFVHGCKEEIAELFPIISNFQFRFKRGAQQEPMTVSDAEMNRFIDAIQEANRIGSQPIYYSPQEITPAMRNRQIRIIGGNLDGYEGTLVSTRGSRRKRILIEIPQVVAASIEVEPEFIELI